MRSNTVLIVVAALVLATIAVLAAGRAGLFAGTPPALGIADGELLPCPPTPNCVVSQADPADATHHVAPITFHGDPAKVWAALADAVRATAGATILDEQAGYLRAEFVSRVLGFVDDVEFRLDSGAKRIHVRSASRLGRSDFGVNRARVEAIRARLAAREV
jgi:uncharacterized protein (DUF1499 family)